MEPPPCLEHKHNVAMLNAGNGSTVKNEEDWACLAVQRRSGSYSNKVVNNPSSKDEGDHSSPLLTETSDDGSSESDASISVGEDKENGVSKPEYYAWSDDDDYESFNDDVSRPSEGEEFSEESDAEEYVPTTAKHIDQDPNRKDHIVQDSSVFTASNRLSAATESNAKSGTYHWISSDDNSNDEESEKTRHAAKQTIHDSYSVG